MKRVSNRDAEPYVSLKREFKGSNTFGEWINGNYVVYSYGYHFPMYACIKGQWYRNTDRYSQTTSKHQGQLRPSISEDFVSVDTVELKKLI